MYIILKLYSNLLFSFHFWWKVKNPCGIVGTDSIENAWMGKDEAKSNSTESIILIVN